MTLCVHRQEEKPGHFRNSTETDLVGVSEEYLKSQGNLQEEIRFFKNPRGSDTEEESGHGVRPWEGRQG